ncbi:hypothetical protein D623_10030437 [Myotis brandtii]|uniref:Uncharacterized protein n=1 Tax=Myotis brandtii TaxID=109478 RepID=S7MLI5_MYOBR|nr:hypothetical protein D623_10030437 [Myotis brandtii]
MQPPWWKGGPSGPGPALSPSLLFCNCPHRKGFCCPTLASAEALGSALALASHQTGDTGSAQ